MTQYIYRCAAFLIMLLSTFTTVAFSGNSKTFLTGKITDKETGLTIPGAAVYIPDMKTGAVTNAEGIYLIENLPQKKLLIQVSFTGYKVIIETIDLTTSTTKDFAMEIAVKELNEVIVTGHSQAGEKNRTPSPISSISETELLQKSSSNIIDAIASEPGISQITTGSGISKPVIRGLGFNRVVVVNDGVRQEGQQWGDEHGIEIDEFSIKKVEILKGPASLSYGSDAIAGVINLFSETGVPQGKIKGSLFTGYQTNNGALSYSANIAGNLKGILWNLRYSNKVAHAYTNKYDGYVYNSGFKENTVSGVLGLNKAWGYSHLHFSIYDLNPGLIEAERDSATGKFIKPVIINDSTAGAEIVENEDLSSYDIGIPFQKIVHYKAILNNSFIIRNSSVKAVFGFQQNHRKEYADVFSPANYGLYFLLNTINYDVRYVLPEKNAWDVSFGINGMQQSSLNKGTEYLVPEYDLFDAGVFTIVKKSFRKLDISGGVRFDTRAQSIKELYLNGQGERTELHDSTSILKFKGFNPSFSGISGSIGAAYQFSEKLYAKFNVARGYRAPNIAELSSNGVHEGTQRYEYGNTNLKAETSLQFDLSFGLNTEHITAEIDLFNNRINDFIFSRKLNSIYGGDSISEGLSSFQFVSGNANLYGGELILDIHPHPLDWLHFENSFSIVHAENMGQADSMKYLPFIPAPKLESELRADLKKSGKFFSNTFIKIGMENYFEQNRFYSAYGTETATPAYMLLNAGIGTTLMTGSKTVCSIIINVTNLTDQAYQSHLSRLKYGAVNNISGRTGVYNMGRNISFKILIPLDLRK
jgi:iron complex outermembrane receptor protein